MAPLRALIFGYGFAGAWIHDPLIRAVPGMEVAAVVTSSAERRKLARSRDPAMMVFSTAAEAVDGADADVAVVATPNRHHVELAVASMQAGMAVVVDKPLANTADQARRLVDEAKSLGKTLAVFQNRRWDGDFLTIGQLIEAGRLGTIHRLTSRFDRWVPGPGANWRDEPPESGGGLLLDLGSHLVDQAIQLLGPVHTVYSELMTLAPSRRSEDDVFISLRHVSGAVSHLYAGALEGDSSRRFRVSGSEGTYVKDGKDIQEERLLAGATVVPGSTGVEPAGAWGSILRGTETERVETVPGDWSIFYKQLAAHVNGDGPIPVTGEEACDVLQVLDAARASAHTSSVVPLGSM